MSNRILIAEDDISICEMVSNYLTGEGFTVDAFQNGSAAVRAFGGKSGYSLALVDLMLPDMSGMDVISERRHTG